MKPVARQISQALAAAAALIGVSGLLPYGHAQGTKTRPLTLPPSTQRPEPGTTAQNALASYARKPLQVQVQDRKDFRLRQPPREGYILDQGGSAAVFLWSEDLSSIGSREHDGPLFDKAKMEWKISVENDNATAKGVLVRTEGSPVVGVDDRFSLRLDELTVLSFDWDRLAQVGTLGLDAQIVRDDQKRVIKRGRQRGAFTLTIDLYNHETKTHYVGKARCYVISNFGLDF